MSRPAEVAREPVRPRSLESQGLHLRASTSLSPTAWRRC